MVFQLERTVLTLRSIWNGIFRSSAYQRVTIGRKLPYRYTATVPVATLSFSLFSLTEFEASTFTQKLCVP